MSQLIKSPKAHRHRNPSGSFNEHLQNIVITMGLYPLKRIQSNLQIKKTYANQEIRQCTEFVTRCTHYGIRSLYRGLSAYFARVVAPFGVYQAVNAVQEQGKQTQKETWEMHAMKYGVLGVMYALVYPFENARVRMGADVESHRVYKNTRDCFSKMRKIEGRSSFYRGFTLSLPIFLLQCTATLNIFEYLVSQQNAGVLPTWLKDSPSIVLFLASYFSTEVLLYPLDSIRYTYEQHRKIVQINGSINHDNTCVRYRDVFTFHKMNNLYQGLGVKLTHGLIYTGIALGLQKQADLY